MLLFILHKTFIHGKNKNSVNIDAVSYAALLLLPLSNTHTCGFFSFIGYKPILIVTSHRIWTCYVWTYIHELHELHGDKEKDIADIFWGFFTWNKVHVYTAVYYTRYNLTTLTLWPQSGLSAGTIFRCNDQFVLALVLSVFEYLGRK